MNRSKIILRAEETARKLRRAERLTGDPLYRDANKAILALLGVVGTGQNERRFEP